MRSKAEARARALHRREALGPEYRQEASHRISERLRQEGEWRDASVVFLYCGYKDEVQTAELMEAAFREGRQVFLPKVVSDSGMVFVQADPAEELVCGAYGIPEPSMSGAPGAYVRPDIIIVPCVAADRRGNRIGHGKGYYDRSLVKYGDIPFVCLAYDCQLADEFETEDTDIKMDMIITEKEIIRL